MVKNLMFDLGGVIMDIRRENCVEAFRKLGMAEAGSYLGEYSQAGPFEGIENGEYSVDDFHREIRAIIGRDEITDQEIDNAFQAFLLGIPAHRLDELEKLHGRYGMYLLSNTNPIMWNDMIDAEFRKCGRSIDYYFDGMVTSFEARAMKPDPTIFRTAVEKFGIRPEETLFFDDSQKNLDAASKLGFRTLLVPPGSEFASLLKSELS